MSRPDPDKIHQLRIVFWETTARCNLNCLHCRRQDMGPGADARELSTDEAKAWIGGLAEWCRPLLILSGGEPLVRADIFEIAAFASGKGFPVALATNGTLVSSGIAEEIQKAGVRRVSVSLDGAEAATHDELRGVRGAFKTALAGLRALKSAGVSTQINMTVCRRNRGEVPALFSLVKREGADAVHLFLFVPVGCGLAYGKDQELEPGEVEELMRWFHRADGRAGIESRMTCAPQYQRLLAEEGGALAVRPRGCLAGRSVCFVSHTGEVYPCGYFPVSAGNIREAGLQAIWEGAPVFGDLRDPDRLGAPCGECLYSVACGGCRARAFTATGDYLAGDHTCLSPKADES